MGIQIRIIEPNDASCVEYTVHHLKVFTIGDNQMACRYYFQRNNARPFGIPFRANGKNVTTNHGGSLHFQEDMFSHGVITSEPHYKRHSFRSVNYLIHGYSITVVHGVRRIDDVNYVEIDPIKNDNFSTLLHIIMRPLQLMIIHMSEVQNKISANFLYWE